MSPKKEEAGVVMARYRGPVCKLCRREGLKLFLKGQKCLTEKCILNTRTNPPGIIPKRRAKRVGYGLQLREKQKVKRIYGVLEKPFVNYFKKARRMKGITGENLLLLLESRLDNIVYRMGIAASRAQARSMISHGHVLVNDRKVDIPSYRAKISDKISLSEQQVSSTAVAENIELARGVGLVANWVKMADDGKSGEVVQMPSRSSIDIPIKEQVIVELYSK